ncbi:MAG: plasmid pRiA4b ORF-3 family protein [Terriglobia bacterium]
MTRAGKTKSKRFSLTSVCQFLIVLPRTEPLVWRRIQVPERYSFWDLHVAIQDAMGWEDYHLHEFIILDSKPSRVTRIGIPDDEMLEERPYLAGWNVPIRKYLAAGSEPIRYRYDFGDNWEHIVEFEEWLPADSGIYPRCIAGAGACPPEDVGGTGGYAEFLRTIANRRHPERAALLEWVGGAFDPHAFDPGIVQFDDPTKRWKTAFEQGGGII